MSTNTAPKTRIPIRSSIIFPFILMALPTFRFSLFAFRFSLFAFRFSLFAFRFSLFALFYLREYFLTRVFFFSQFTLISIKYSPLKYSLLSLFLRFILVQKLRKLTKYCNQKCFILTKILGLSS